MVALVNKAGAARGSKGFTLVELLVVIVVIGILAAIAVPIFLSQSDKANDAALQSDLANAAKLLQVAEASGETLPSTMTAGQVADLGVAGTITPNATLTVSGSGATLCVEGTSDSGDTYSVNMTAGLTMTDCAGNNGGGDGASSLLALSYPLGEQGEVPGLGVGAWPTLTGVVVAPTDGCLLYGTFTWSASDIALCQNMIQMGAGEASAVLTTQESVNVSYAATGLPAGVFLSRLDGRLRLDNAAAWEASSSSPATVDITVTDLHANTQATITVTLTLVSGTMVIS